MSAVYPCIQCVVDDDHGHVRGYTNRLDLRRVKGGVLAPTVWFQRLERFHNVV